MSIPLVGPVVMRQAVVWARLATPAEAQSLPYETLEGLWVDLWHEYRYVCLCALDWGRANKPDVMQAMSVAGRGKR